VEITVLKKRNRTKKQEEEFSGALLFDRSLLLVSLFSLSLDFAFGRVCVFRHPNERFQQGLVFSAFPLFSP
jgi:hypothetical protein